MNGRIVSLLRPHLAAILLGVVAATAYAVLDASAYVLLIPFADALFAGGAGASGGPMQRVLEVTVYRWIDLGGDPLDAVSRIMLLLLAVLLVKNVFAFARSYFLARAEQGVSRDLRNDVYGHLVELDLGFFGRVRTGQIVSRLTTEIEQLRVLVTKEMSRLVGALLEFVVALGATLLISWRLTLAAFVVIPLAMGVWGPLVRLLRRRDRRVLHLGGEVNAHLLETLTGIRLVKSSSAEARERTRFRRLTEEYFQQFTKAELARAMAAPLTEVLAAVGTLVLLWYGAHLVVAGDVSGAHFVGFLGLSVKLYAPVKSLAKFPATAQPGLVAAERVFEFLDAPILVRDAPDAVRLHGFDDEITFEDVRFSYRDGHEALRGISFAAQKGTVTALVGPSGAGKSTAVDLLARFFDVTGGSIEIDGVDVRRVRIADLRALMGIVSQECVLFHDTVRANIAYGRPDASLDEIEGAARAANAHDFIVRMAGGYGAVIGERGVELSGGERQRVAIARALLRDPPILILDEATSALDSESEWLIRDAMDHLLEGRTVIVVAHRLSTVQRADQILVLEHGEIVERGDHATLLAMSGRYKRLHDLQFEDAPAGVEW